MDENIGVKTDFIHSQVFEYYFALTVNNPQDSKIFVVMPSHCTHATSDGTKLSTQFTVNKAHNEAHKQFTK